MPLSVRLLLKAPGLRRIQQQLFDVLSERHRVGLGDEPAPSGFDQFRKGRMTRLDDGHAGRECFDDVEPKRFACTERVSRRR